MQNGNIWIPSTPERPVVQRLNYVPLEMQQSQMGAGNWQDLIGFYTGLLQDETCNDMPKKFEPNGNMGLNREEHNVRDFGPCKTRNWLPQNLNPTGIVGMNFGEHINIQDYAQTEKLRRLNQNAASVGSNLQNIGDVPPPKVNPVAKLMGMKGSLCVSQTNGVPDRSTYAMDKPNITNSSQVESRYGNCESTSTTLQQNHILHANQGIGGHSLQQIPSNGLPVPYWHNYNLNFLRRSETGEFSTLDKPYQLGSVTPDQQKQSKNYQISPVPCVLIDEISTEANDKHENVVLSQQPETADESNHDKYLINKLRTSSAAILKLPPEEKNYFNGGDVGRIDLNKTPLQKTPKRRKHRPKVIVEGKPKRTPKSAAAKNNTPNGPTRKRKYVRKSGIETSTQLTDVANNVNVSNVEPAAKSCRRALNFHKENGVEKESYSREFDYQALNNEGSKASTMNLDSNNAGKSTELNGPSTSTVKEGHKNINGEAKQHTKNSYNSVNSINKIHPQESLPPAPTAQARTSKDHALNVIARSWNARNANIKQSVGQNRYGPVHHMNGVAHFVIQGNTKEQFFYGTTQPMLQSGVQLLEHMVGAIEKQGSTRECSHTEPTHPQTVTLKGSQLWSHGVYKTSHYNSFNSNKLKNASESSIEETTMPSDTTPIEDCLGQNESRENKRFHAQSSALHPDGGLPNSDSKGDRTSKYSKSKANKVVCDQDINSTEFRIKFQQQHNPSHEHLLSEQMAQKTSPRFDKMHRINSLCTANYCNLGSAPQSDPKFTQGDEIINYPACVLVNIQTAGPISSKHLSSIDKVRQQETRSSRDYEHLSKEVTGSGEKRDLILVDHITARMKDLNINNNGKKIVRTKQSALVPYRGDGAVVPYEAFDPIKKRRPRPKVDLDPETNKLWNLLLSKEESEGAETMNTDRQKWWEEERKVFRGRVDSFIARMHLVQGDRRFSKWKGSVVDSVIGVFLTQNVSDHLSSSAFMTLAAKFPLKSATIKQKYPKNGECPVKNEVRITFPDGATVSDHKMIKEQMYNHSLVASSASSKDREDNVITGTRTDLRNGNTRRTEQNTISSQSSSESFIFQASEDIRASAGSKSEFEDQITGRDFRKIRSPLSFSEQSERIAAFQQYQFQIMEKSFQHQRPFISHQQLENPADRHIPRLANSRNAYAYPFTLNVPHHKSPVPLSSNSRPNTSKGLEKWKTCVLEFLGKESTSSLALTDFNTPQGMGGESICDNAEHGVESSFIDQQTGQVKFQPLTENCAVPNKHLEQQADFPAVPQRKNGQHIKHGQGGTQETFQKESTFRTDPVRPAEALSKNPSGNQKPSGNTTHEPSEMKHEKSSGNPSSEIRETSNARKRKAEKERTEPFIWDTLRKEVQLKVGTIGRSRDPMDSLDYDALQKADVREISETIKQRGMNNMLAERIKDFLNRLVRDHGKSDLEWLRDVPPDKAKDYLLSIRGLGLKSVECVRLLTLHHLAFPVDTNVGRIAVRLGWVPLQPLPESLQLHLLELYPVLESIQKYIWPRLCKLDQETLYELHYQMITFGKVFCTKRDPNCNACPMRGECRHFASAFASARLALPGPEERRVVCSATSTNDKKSSDVTIDPLPLLSVEDNLEKGTGLMRNFEPIIEEPTTPEPPIEMSERDIEDTFYEDPDEIPVIKLDIEEFTTNLQNFMKGQMEMQEGDMSKPLVALSPRLASIPMPKLKHVGRLRTEHQVYELPDSHPLLKELDRREPDDPSPYLLAIWTPGETADSVQPPESTCSPREGGGPCNNETCLSCNSIRETQAQIVRGTILIPCRTAMRGSFPLNGTYFQVNEVFADHESSMNPVDVPRSLLWNLPRRTVFFGTSVSTIFKGMSTEDIQYSFWKGFVCVRAFEQKLRAPRPLTGRLHQPAYKVVKQNEKRQSNAA